MTFTKKMIHDAAKKLTESICASAVHVTDDTNYRGLTSTNSRDDDRQDSDQVDFIYTMRKMQEKIDRFNDGH